VYIDRALTDSVKKAGRSFPVVMVTGPRQVGKTTFLRHICEDNRTYVSLDDQKTLSLALEDPGLFFQRFKPPILIDEFQYAPDLLSEIKILADKTHKPGRFWLTGSQHFHLMKEVSESLAGRVGILQLLGLSRLEREGRAQDSIPFLPGSEGANDDEGPDLMSLYRNIWRGSYPALAVDTELDRDLFYSSYIQTYLQRDIQHLTKVGDEMTFYNFLRAAAARTGQLLNMADMARDAGVSPNTAKNWLSILKTSGIVYLLEPYHSNLTKRIVKTPKLYFIDTGLASYLTEWSSPETLEAGSMTGAVFETYAVIEILKSYWFAGKKAPLYFYRDIDGKELDCIIVKDGTLYPVEIKKSTAVTKDDISHFSVVQRFDMPVGQGSVICMTDTVMPVTRSVRALPITLL
jgi:hypothetical protein